MFVPSPTVADVTIAVAALVTDAPAADVPDSRLVGDLEQLFTVKSQIDAAIHQRLRAADSRQATTNECGRHTRAWMVEEAMVERACAGRKMRLVRQLWQWPDTETAWLAGDISEDHVAVICTAMKWVPAEHAALVEKTLIELSRFSAPHVVSAAVDEILVSCGVEKSSEEAAARRHNSRGVTVAKTFGGTGSLAGTLTPVLADKLQRVLDLVGAPAGADDDRTRAQRNHDALETIVDHYTDSANLPDQVAGERPARVIVTIDLTALQRELEEAWGKLPSGAQISPATARRLACDAEIIPAVLGGPSDVLDMGRGSRTFNAATRRAAVLRDGDRCVFPDCQNPRRELHHWRKHWADGGRSDLDNAAWLCGYHHWLVHEGKWTMWREADGGYTFTSPGLLPRRRTSSKVPRLLE